MFFSTYWSGYEPELTDVTFGDFGGEDEILLKQDMKSYRNKLSASLSTTCPTHPKAAKLHCIYCMQIQQGPIISQNVKENNIIVDVGHTLKAEGAGTNACDTQVFIVFINIFELINFYI